MTRLEYAIHVLVITGIYIILTLSLNLTVGFTGLPVLGHAAFACVGAYTSSLLAITFGASPWIGLASAAVVSAAFGLVVAVLCIRLRDDYLALATFGFGVIVYSVAKNWTELTGGPLGISGIPPFAIFGFRLSSAWSCLPLVGAFAGLTYWIERRITESPFGRVLRSIRDDDVAAAIVGKQVDRFKLQAFGVSAFFAGIAGSLYAHYISFIDPATFNVVESVAVLLMVVFGGAANLWGSAAGATILVLLPESLRFLGLPHAYAAPIRQIVYGLLLVIIILTRPQGVFKSTRSE